MIASVNVLLRRRVTIAFAPAFCALTLRALTVLAEGDPTLVRLFSHRFETDKSEELNGMAFGNLFLAALMQQEGSFLRAVEVIRRLVDHHLAEPGLIPASYRDTEAARKGLDRLRGYFRDHPAPSLHHRAWLLWASMNLDGLMTPAGREARRKASVLGLEGLGWDIGHAVRFLLSAHARYITGQTLVVDGGASLVGPARAP